MPEKSVLKTDPKVILKNVGRAKSPAFMMVQLISMTAISFVLILFRMILMV